MRSLGRRLLTATGAACLAVPLISTASHAEEVVFVDHVTYTVCEPTPILNDSPLRIDLTVCTPVKLDLYFAEHVPDSTCQQCYAVLTPAVGVSTGSMYLAVTLRNGATQVVPIPVPPQTVATQPICLYTNDPFFHMPCLVVL